MDFKMGTLVATCQTLTIKDWLAQCPVTECNSKVCGLGWQYVKLSTYLSLGYALHVAGMLSNRIAATCFDVCCVLLKNAVILVVQPSCNLPVLGLIEASIAFRSEN